MNELLFYFDVVCPFAYLASTQVQRIAAEHRAKLVYRPMLLGGILRALSAPMDPNREMVAAKAKLNRIDLQRWAAHWQVPLHFPTAHPRRTVAAMRLCCAAQIAGRPIDEVAAALFRAYWVEGSDLADRTVLATIADRFALPIDAIDREETKQALRATTDEALAAGVFGAPSFVVVVPAAGGPKRHLFWGQDRLHFVAKALGGWEVPA